MHDRTEPTGERAAETPKNAQLNNKANHGLRLRKGRGALSNSPSRFLHTVNQPLDDGWGSQVEPSRVANRALPDRTVRLITRNTSPDIPFSQSINPYKGCEHGCIYCFARPTHAFLDLSPGLDFETRLFFKTNVAEGLRKELTRPRYQCSTLAMGTNTDPYQPLEKDKRIMREILQILLEARHPVSIVTKSALILRDLDLLRDLARQQLVHVNVSVTTLSNELKTRLEPRTAGPAARLRAISALREAGIPTGAMLAPIIPFINDHEVERLVSACADAGAQTMAYILIRLPLEVAGLFEEWLQIHYPLKADRVMAAIRDTRGGEVYRAEWGTRMVGQGQIAQLIGARFKAAVAKAGLHDANLSALRTDLFQPPRYADDRQQNLF